MNGQSPYLVRAPGLGLALVEPVTGVVQRGYPIAEGAPAARSIATAFVRSLLDSDQGAAKLDPLIAQLRGDGAGGHGRCLSAQFGLQHGQAPEPVSLWQPHRPADASLWQVLRQALEARGLRIRARTGELPSAILNAAGDLAVWEVLDLDEKVVSEGKGQNAETALCSALAEAVERLVAQSWPEATLWIGAAADLDRMGLSYPRLEAGVADLYSPALPMEWIGAWTADGRAGALPAELAFYPFNPATGVRAFSCQHTAGLAAGETFGAAAIVGLRECLETDAYWLSMRTKHVDAVFPPLVDVKHAGVRCLARRLSDAGIRPHAGLISFDWPVPIVHVVLETLGESLPALSHGLGSGRTAAAALERALLEAVQVYSGLEKVALQYWPEIAVGPDRNPDPAIQWSSTAFASRIIKAFERAPVLVELNGAQDRPIEDVAQLHRWLGEQGYTVWAAELGGFGHLRAARVFVDGAVSAFTERNGPSRRVLEVVERLGLPAPYIEPVLT